MEMFLPILTFGKLVSLDDASYLTPLSFCATYDK